MRRRMVRLAVLAAVLAVALFGVPLALAVTEYAEANEFRDLESVAEATGLGVASDLYDDVPDELPDKPDGVVIGLYDEDGVLLMGTAPALPDRQVRQAMRAKVGRGHEGNMLVVAIPVTHDDDVIGVVRAATPRSVIAGAVWPAWLAMVVLAGLAIGTVTVTARRQAQDMARPLEELAHAARRLGDGDFSVRAEPADIPEIDSVGHSLNTTAERLGELLRRERAFSAEASHQMRTPLAGLRLQLEAALVDPNGDVRGAVRSALESVDRLERTVSELLTLARGSRGTDRGPLDLRGLLDEIRQGWRRRLGTTGREVRLVITPDTPRATASTAAVRQILAVLVDNALVHGAGPVTVAARDAGGVLAIDVSDQGALTASEADLFAPRDLPSDGHGIGLAFARRLAEAEGGRLRLTARRPTTFTVLLPVIEPVSTRPEPTPKVITSVGVG